MTNKDIQDFSDSIRKKIADGRIFDAVNQLKSASEHVMLWETSDKIDNLYRNYSLMIEYMLKGVNDPQRSVIYADIKDKLLTYADVVRRKQHSIDAPTLYYNTLRVASLHQNRGENSLNTLINKAIRATSGQEAIATGEEIFRNVWTEFPLSKDTYEVLSTMLTDAGNDVPAYLRALVVNALILGQLEYYDASRLKLLIHIYKQLADRRRANDKNAVMLSTLAVIGLYFSFIRHSDRKITADLQEELNSLSEIPDWSENLSSMAMEWIRTLDTERINKKMREELIPGFMKMRPDIMRKMNLSKDQLNSLSDIAGNPEWEEILKKSGIESAMRELSELQNEGGDVFMSTFSHLKQFPFFNNISSWFVPFDAETPYLTANADSSALKLAESLFSAPFLCDSDKYSFIMSLSVLPESQRQMMRNQIDAQAENIAEAAKSAKNSLPSNVWRATVRCQLQNLYRFYKLFRRKGEFFDPFASEFTPDEVPVTGEMLRNADTLNVYAEMYFKFGMYSKAFKIFNQVDMLGEPDSYRYQKMGYCLELEGKTNEALSYYEKADLTGGESAWTTRRIAICARATRNYPKAISALECLEKSAPDDIDLALLMGFVYTEAERYEEALQKFRKVEFYRPDSIQAWRSLAWILFLSRDFTNSLKYYTKIISGSPSSEDYLNMGHVSLALGQMLDAVNYYRLSIETNTNKETSRELFVKSMETDTAALSHAGIDTDMLPLVIDSTLSNC